MNDNLKNLSRFSSFKIVLLYALVSAVYIYTSDYFLEKLVTDIDLLSKMQTYKGIGFILITAVLLFILVKRNLDTTTTQYEQILDVKKNFNNQLLQSKEEYITLFNHSPLPMWLIDPETLQFLMVNEAACSIYGFSEEEYATMTLRDIRIDEDIPLMEKILFDPLDDNRLLLPSIIRHRKKNGDIIQVKVKATIVTFEGKPVRLASAVDVTAEMDTQNKLLETNAKLQLATDIAGLGYWSNDLIKSEITWSEEVYKIFEVNPDNFKLSLETIKARFHPDDRINFDPEVFSHFENRAVQENEHRIITDSGQTKWILVRQYLIKDNEDKAVRLEGVLLDITQIKRHEQEIWESNERFKILTKATVEAIIDWDIKNQSVIWGEGFHTIMGYDHNTDNYDLWSDNIHPEDRDKVLDDLQKTLKDPTKFHFNAEFRFVKANGDIAHVQQKGIFIRDADGRAVRALGAMIDLTETLERLRKIELQNKVLKEIAWTQSHVVRAPLANLIGLVTLLKEGNTSSTNPGILVDYISESAKKLDDIIREIVKKSSEIDKL
ncbi:PAS domain-containing protein [Flavobacterium sp. XGLA_31]|uniref:PAS domain-containing protein n=1 Tax=Flavobacterium sp. XGLA_31 TaxID=3447666 RepID=UPI003F406BE2